MGQERSAPSYFFISLVLGPLNSLVWYVPSLRYTLGLGWRMHCGVEVTESSTNKQHHLWREDRCLVVSKQPLHSRAAAKMSQHISISPEPVLTNHTPSQTAAGSHCPAREDSAPHCGTELSRMVLSSPGPLCTPPPSFSPQKTPIRS